MKRFVATLCLFGILGFGFRHLLVPVGHGALKVVKVGKKVLI